MTLYEIIQQRGIEAIGRFYSTYRGIVITPNDPDSQNKVCVHLPSILRGVEVWAYPKHQQGGPGSGFKWLSPREGSIVYVEFEMETQDTPSGLIMAGQSERCLLT